MDDSKHSHECISLNVPPMIFFLPCFILSSTLRMQSGCVVFYFSLLFFTHQQSNNSDLRISSCRFLCTVSTSSTNLVSIGKRASFLYACQFQRCCCLEQLLSTNGRRGEVFNQNLFWLRRSSLLLCRLLFPAPFACAVQNDVESRLPNAFKQSIY